MHSISHVATTLDGWALRLTRFVRPSGTPGAPVLFVHGFGMNSYLMQYHPAGRTFASVLLEQGLDPWAVDLRGTSSSRQLRPEGLAPGLDSQTLYDLPAVLTYIRRQTGHERVHAIGCSLGGSLLFAHAAFAEEPGLGRVVAIGAPLSWQGAPMARYWSRMLQTVGSIPVRGSRHFAKHALPVLAKTAPWLLSVYINPTITDISAPGDITRTVENPIPSVNRAIAEWMRGELRVAGRAVAPALKRFEEPMMVMYGTGDGIVPRPAALSVVGATSGPVEVVEVGHPRGESVGHADLFVSDIAPQAVFEPAARFFAERAAA